VNNTSFSRLAVIMLDFELNRNIEAKFDAADDELMPDPVVLNPNSSVPLPDTEETRAWSSGFRLVVLGGNIKPG
jgi:hypothetical protein